MAPTTECPDLEELAAYMDGTLDAEQRARVTKHLATCDDCFEMFAGVARYLEDEHAAAEEAAGADAAANLGDAVRPGYQDDEHAAAEEAARADPAASPDDPVRPFDPPPSLPTRRRTRRRGWFVLPGGRALPTWPVAALAAVLLLAVGWAVFHTLLLPPPAQSMADLLAAFHTWWRSPSERSIAGQLAQNSGAVDGAPWQQPKRGGTLPGESNEELQPDYESIRFGVRKFDLELALAARGRSGLDAATRRMCALVLKIDLPPETATKQCNSVLNWESAARVDLVVRSNDITPKRGDDGALVAAAKSLMADKDLDERFERPLVELGGWAEACRLGGLAAGVGTVDPRSTDQTTEILDFLRSDTTRQLIDDNLADNSSKEDRIGLGPDGRPLLREVREKIASLPPHSGPGIGKALADVGESCRKILKHYDDE